MTELQARPIHRVAKELIESNGFLLARLGFAFKGKVLTTLEQAGFDPYHYSVLAIVAEGARETQATIADALALDPSRLVAVLDSLEQGGLITRQRDPHDRRRHVVSITAGGRRQLTRLRGVVKQVEADFFAPLDADSRESLHGQLLKLAALHDPSCAFAVAPASAATDADR